MAGTWIMALIGGFLGGMFTVFILALCMASGRNRMNRL